MPGFASNGLDAAIHVVLVQPEIAANVGAIGRTCVAVGAMLWLVRPLGFQIDDRRLRRAGLDYWPHLKWRVVDAIEEIQESLGTDGFWWFSTKGSRKHTEAKFKHGDKLVFGPESKGLSPRLLEKDRERVLRIPMRKEARSLNLANAASIAVYEAFRLLESW